MSRKVERAAFFDALRRGEEPPIPNGTSPAKFDFEIDRPEVSTLVRFITGVLTKGEQDHFLATAATDEPTRERLIRASSILEEFQDRDLSAVQDSRGSDTLEGEVASAWLEIAKDSLEWHLQLNTTGYKVHLSDLVEMERARGEGDSIIRINFDSCATALPASAFRSPKGLLVEGVLDDEGELIVSVVSMPEDAAQWEGRMLEVSIRVEYPVVVGVGAVRNGRLDLHVPGAGSIMRRNSGPINSTDLYVGDAEPEPEPLTLRPLRQVAPAYVEPPRLIDLPTLRDGRLEAEVFVPAEFSAENAGKLFHISACVTRDQWQMIYQFVLEEGQELYPFSVLWPDATREEGKVAIILQYRLLEPTPYVRASSRELIV